MMYWGSTYHLGQHAACSFPSANPAVRTQLIGAFIQALEDAPKHTEGLHEDLMWEAQILVKLLSTHNEYNLNQVVRTTGTIHKTYVTKNMTLMNNKWKQYVNEQLTLGGKKLFQFVSKLDKAFLNVTWDKFDSTAKGPDDFLNNQRNHWAEYWNPSKQQHLHQELSIEYNHFWEAAKEVQEHIEFNASTLEQTLKGYRKDTIGSDIWKPSELRALPMMLKQHMANAISSSLNAIAIPHQNLVSLNPLLGKPNKTCRSRHKSSRMGNLKQAGL